MDPIYEFDAERASYLETMESQNETTESPGTTTLPPVQRKGRSGTRERKAPCWKHYTFFEKFDGKKSVPGEKETTTYARCNLCGKEYKAESNMGTTTASKHIEACLKAHKSDTSLSSPFDQKTFLHMFAQAIICHAYPLRIVEHEYLRKLLTYLNPNVKHVTRNTILKYCILEHEKFKSLLFDTLGKVAGRVSFTCDLWTACTNRGYLTLTAHYVDDNWTLRSKILNFRYCAPPHTGLEVEKFVFNLMKDWNLQGKAFSMTVDNARSMDVMVDFLKKDIMHSSPLPCNGKFFHVRCCAHILNLIVRRGLDFVDVSVKKLREVVKYIDGSDSRLTQFEQAVTEAECVFKGKLRLDVVTRWNATYVMLQKALEAKPALKLIISRFLGVDFKLDDEEWAVIQSVCDFLNPFYVITTLFSGSEYPTANLYFENVLIIEYSIKKARSDPKLAPMAALMLVKFEDYWENYSLILSIALVLDPRYKIQRVRQLLNLLYEGVDLDEKVKVIKEALTELYSFYSTESSTSSSRENIISSSIEIDNDETYRPLKRSNILKLCGASDDDPTRCPMADLEAYLNTPRLPLIEGEKFDILKYWESQVVMYPVLARIARDVLAIPITSVASESSFSMGGRILNKYRGALLRKNVEMLVTTQNWCRGYGAEIDEDVLVIGEEMEAESTSST